MRKRRNKEEPMIHKGLSGSWRVRFFDETKGKLREKSCKTKADAEFLKRAIMQGDDLSPWFSDSATSKVSKTFADLAYQWLDHGEHIRRLSHACLKNYRCHLENHVLPVIGQVHLRDLNIDHIEQIARELRKKKAQTKSYTAVRKGRFEDEGDGLSLPYQKEILTVACMITTWASRRKPALLRENPFEGFKLPACPEHAYDYWSLEDEDKFLDWLDNGGYYEKLTTRYRKNGKSQYTMQLQIRNKDELQDIVMMALRTGLRLGEIGGLRNADVDLAAGFILVRGTYCRKERRRKNTTKNKKTRRIEINNDVREILLKRRDKPQMSMLFNIEMNCIKNFSKTCRQAGVKELHFHGLRHTCLTNLANGYGMTKALPLPKVQQIAGHSDIKTTMRYVHNDIIKDTASLQWSREERIAKKGGEQGRSLHSGYASSRDDMDDDQVGISKGGLRLVALDSSGKNSQK